MAAVGRVVLHKDVFVVLQSGVVVVSIELQNVDVLYLLFLLVLLGIDETVHLTALYVLQKLGH